MKVENVKKMKKDGDPYMTEYNKYGIIAVDFDGTLCEDCYPEIGSANTTLIHYLKEAQSRGSRVILWTCRCGEQLEQAVSWCFRQGLFFDAINTNVPENILQYGTDSRKIYADLYIDDKARTWLPDEWKLCERKVAM